jgi:hypothetical protein
MAVPSAMSPAAWPVSAGRPSPRTEVTASGWLVRLPFGAGVPGVGPGVAVALIRAAAPLFSVDTWTVYAAFCPPSTLAWEAFTVTHSSGWAVGLAIGLAATRAASEPEAGDDAEE